MRAAAAGLALITLGACSPKAEAPAPQPLALDCSKPFEAQKAAILAQPGLNPAPKDSSEPYRYYSTADGRASWVITEPGAPGHPAILMQTAQAAGQTTTGCPYGDKAGYEQLRAYIESLKAARGPK